MPDWAESSDGDYTVQAKATDKAGNSRAGTAITFTLDNNAPTGSVVVNGGDEFTVSATVALTLSASDDGVGVDDMRFSNDGSTWSGWEDYATAKSWTLAAGADGSRTVYVKVTDKAGNTREMRLAYELKNVRYRKSTIALSDAFVQNKVAPLLPDVAARQGALKDVFVAVNKNVRKDNEDRIAAITSKATPTILWKDAFAQLSNSKVEANFADERTYTYKGEAINTAYHLGYDLSVTKNYPVEAANSGTVAYAGDLGIYGNAVILDHGLGLYTLYSHLNSIDVKEGDTLAKRQILGKTGETGLAAGDHLHYGVYIGGVAVLPVEWWDQKWIDDNITAKLQGRSGQEIAEAQQPARPARKAAPTKRRR
jgi:murein DD-endopeptidase MepM/ murein hydrolase activator NlpD